jgi:thiopurine S-methyltransferase
MEHQFWLERWKSNNIGFHNSAVNPMLVNFISSLSLCKCERILLPLCGKTLDIGWLISKGFKVVGIELAELAIVQLFEELKVKPTIKDDKISKHYCAENLDIHVADFFKTTPETIGPVNAIFDRAALVALPQEMRVQYSKHLGFISNFAKQLLVTFDYDQEKIPGPPFSVKETEVKQLYQSDYEVSLLGSFELPGGLKGKVPATENVWLLGKKVP